MFRGCAKLTELGLCIKTDKVTDMSYMFYGCKKLTSVDLRSFNTQNVDGHELYVPWL
jgi:bacterial surface protein 26-residue repeat